MKKELFKHEIVILKNTFLRLLRRGASTNLVKLIKKTHPADLAIVFRYFDEDQQKEVFTLTGWTPNNRFKSRAGARWDKNMQAASQCNLHVFAP